MSDSSPVTRRPSRIKLINGKEETFDDVDPRGEWVYCWDSHAGAATWYNADHVVSIERLSQAERQHAEYTSDGEIQIRPWA